MLSSHPEDEAYEEKPRRKSANKNVFVESEDEVDEAFETGAKSKKATKKDSNDDADFELALELSKADSKPAPRNSKKPRVSFISENDDDEDEAFEEIEEEIVTEDDDDAFSEEVEEEPKAAKKKKGATPSKAKSTTATAKKSSSPAAKAKKSSNKPAPTVKASPVSKPASKPIKRTFEAPTGVSIVSGQGPRLRVGLSKRAIPKGPLSPSSVVRDMAFGCCGSRSRSANVQAAETFQPAPMQEVTFNQAPVHCVIEEDLTIASSTLNNKGQPLKPLKSIQWKSDTPMTKDEVDKKREEFWETAAEFGGKAEVWNALKATIETSGRDLALAQAIIECAGIVLPTGEITEAYDEFGYKYLIPEYCLYYPENMNLTAMTGKKQTAGKRSQSFSQTQPNNLRKLKIRMNSGEDLSVELTPAMTTVKDLEEAMRRSLSIPAGSEEKMLFFRQGSGPIKPETGLHEVSLDVPLQAWMIPKIEPKPE